MRITTANAFDMSLANLQGRQRQLADSQERLTSGKRVSKASDDPTAAARAERAMARMDRVDANLRALDASRGAMQQTESALGDAGELMQQLRENLVQAGNAGYTDAERGNLAVAMRGLRTQLLSVANRSDGAGGFLFGGQGSATPPFVDAPGGVQFAGTTGALRAATEEPMPLSIDGRAAWLGVPNPVAGAPDLSLFNTIDTAIAQLETPGQTTANIIAAVHTGLGEVDAAMTHLSGWRARTGEALRMADAIQMNQEDIKLSAQTERSAAEDVDMIKAISDFQGQQTGYEAALKTYATIQRMSLFNYLTN